MRTKPPNSLVRYRHGLLALALLAWAVAAYVIVFLKGHETFPIAAIVSLAGFVFVWANGFYWWLMLRYPRIEINSGEYASYDEWKERNSGPFFAIYWVFSILATIGFINVATHG